MSRARAAPGQGPLWPGRHIPGRRVWEEDPGWPLPCHRLRESCPATPAPRLCPPHLVPTRGCASGGSLSDTVRSDF